MKNIKQPIFYNQYHSHSDEGGLIRKFSCRDKDDGPRNST